MLAIVRNDSHVHQAELKKKKKERKRKKMSSFPILRNCSRPFARLFACLLARSLALFSVSLPIALMSCTKEYPHAPCHTQHHGYEDDDDDGCMVLASKSQE